MSGLLYGTSELVGAPGSELDRVVAGEHHDPHSVLGAHPARDADGRDVVVIRGWRPDAVDMAIVLDGGKGERIAMRPLHPAGVFGGVVAGTRIPDYRLEVTYPGDAVVTVDDPYRFWPTMGELDLHLLGEGRHEGLWRHLGAHVRVHQAVTGTSFAVWAPNARSVRVVGDFNSWDGRMNPMRTLGGSGVWEIFLPDVAAGAHYKYEVLTQQGHLGLRADPFAFATEVPPSTASVVYDASYTWRDAAGWPTGRPSTR